MDANQRSGISILYKESDDAAVMMIANVNGQEPPGGVYQTAGGSLDGLSDLTGHLFRTHKASDLTLA